MRKYLCPIFSVESYFQMLSISGGVVSCEFECIGFKHDAILKLKIKMRMVLMFAAFSSLLFREKTNREGAISSQEKDATYLFHSKRERQIPPL